MIIDIEQNLNSNFAHHKELFIVLKINKGPCIFFLLQYCNTRLFNEPGTVMYLFYSIMKYINGGNWMMEKVVNPMGYVKVNINIAALGLLDFIARIHLYCVKVSFSP